jgi:hypothetical protein
MRCPNCRKRIPKDSLWCDNCGYQNEKVLSELNKTQDGYPKQAELPQTAKPPKRDVNWPRIIVFSVIAALIIIPLVVTTIAITGSIQQIKSSVQNAVSSFEIQLPGSEQTAKTGVTHDNYEKVYPGMFYKDVVKLFGKEGTVAKSDGTDITYTWKNDDAIVTIEFVKDAAVRKTQSGL